jgi:hypothetical protein
LAGSSPGLEVSRPLPLQILYAFVMPRLGTAVFNEDISMTDLLMIVFTVAFFAVALLYTAACEKLR